MNKILALVDGSTYAQSVCDHAGWAASRTNADVVLCHVMKSRGTTSDNTNLSGSIGLGARSALLEELAEVDRARANLLKQRGRAILDDATLRVKAQGANSVADTLRHGRFIESVGELESDVDLIVIGKRGETSTIDMEHLGSNLERVVRSTAKPVLVTSREYKSIEKVVVAFDGGESVQRAIRHLSGSRLFQGLAVELVQVGDKQPRTLLEQSRDVLTENAIDATCSVLNGQPEDVIARFVSEGGYDMLVMGAYGHSRIRHLIIGSTTTQMIHKCRVPIMLFR